MDPLEQLDRLTVPHNRAKSRLLKCIVVLLIAIVIGVWDGVNFRSDTLPSMLTPRGSNPNIYHPKYIIIQDEHTGAYSAISFYEFPEDTTYQTSAWVFTDGVRAGFMAPWFQTKGLRLSITSRPARSHSDAELQAIRHAVADALAIEQDWRSTKSINRLRKTDSPYFTVNPIYLLIDIAAITAIVVAIRTRKELLVMNRQIRFLRYLINEQCPTCRYDLSGIAHQAFNCPECGQSLPQNIADDPPAQAAHQNPPANSPNSPPYQSSAQETEHQP